MSSDNTLLNAGTGGETLRSLGDANDINWPAGLSAYPTTISAGANVIQLVDLTHGLPVQPQTGATFTVTGAGGSLTVDNGGTFAVQVDGAALTSLQLLDDVVFAEDAAHSSGNKGIMALSVRKDTATALTDADGDYQPLLTDASGALFVNVSNSLTIAGAVDVNVTSGSVAVTDGAGSITVDDGGGSLTVDGTVAATQSGTWNIGTVTTVTGVTTVSTVTALTTCSTVTTLTGSGVAHDAADSGNPHKIGAKATTALSGVTLVADADRTDLRAGIDGVLITRPYCNLEDIVTATPVAITDGASTSVIAAQGAGVKVYITEVAIANSSASNVTVDLRDGTAGSVKWTFPVPANGGVVKTFAVPLGFSANTAIAADPSAAASTITVSLLGFKSKV